MIIRNERESDYEVVENLIRNAFWNVNMPGATEHYMAHIMRDHSDFVAELDMVAEIDGKVVGSIMYTVCKLRSQAGDEKACLSFGPLAVDPAFQRKGVGKALIETTLERAKELGYQSVVIFGHPANYINRGFVSCKRFNVCLEGIYPTAMLVKPLTDDAFDGNVWFFEESSVCQFDIEEAEKYDKKFPVKQKQVLPSQEEFYIYSHSTIN
ncbi:MAG: GNAT family N-acetyltransferase [Candidatus Coproplasma sp.]